MRTSEQARRLRSTWWRPASLAWERGDDADAYYRWIMAKYSMTRTQAEAHIASTQHHCGLIRIEHAPRDAAAEAVESPAVTRAPADPVEPILKGLKRLRSAQQLHRVLHAVEEHWQSLSARAA